MKKTIRNPGFERRGAGRELVIPRGPVQGPLFLKPSFSISAQSGGLTVSVSVHAPKESTPHA